jgi:trk system potassium uptake protein
VRLFAVQRILGAVLALSGLIMLPPLVMSLLMGDGQVRAFSESFIGTIVVGLAMWLPVRNHHEELRLRDGFLVTSATWIIVSIACAVPFVLGASNLSFTDAFFESVSGLTTTGATTIAHLDGLPKSLLFYRQLLCFLGGMGIIILAVAILPMLKIGGSQLFRAESTGPVKDTKLTPRIAETARALWFVYLGLNVACTLAYWIGGMGFFDAVGHAMSTVATAGFSTHDASIGYFDSAVIEAISVVFMFIGGINFSLHYVAWRRATGSIYFTDAELKAYFAIALTVSVIVAFGAFAAGSHASFALSIRHAVFQTVSNLTTTGYTTTGFVTWGSFVPAILILIGFIGGCSGSTAGGMKVARIVMLFRQGAREVMQLVHPRGRFVVKLGGMSVSGAVLAAVTGFCTLYVMAYVVMSLAVAATGVDLVSAWSSVATCLNNMGPGLGITAVHFADMNSLAVWICSFAMILGRLEVFTLLVLFTPAFWRN